MNKKYLDSSYNILMFFSEIHMTELNNYTTWLNDFFIYAESKNLKIKIEGVFEPSQLSFKKIKKSNYNDIKLKNIIESSKNNKYLQLGIYFFDDGFTDENPPNIYININTWYNPIYTKNKFHNDANLFVMIALNETLDICKSELNKKYKIIFNKMKGIQGYFYEETNFYYDGKSDLGWAYHNVQSKISDKNILTWNESKYTEKLIQS
jgi:hypothetical protein